MGCWLAVFLSMLITACADDDKTPSYSRAYDPARDPFADVELASLDARKTDRKILLEIGGDWCSWCHILDRYLHDNAKVGGRLSEVFVLVKVNYSDENPNEKFMSHLPPIEGYPHFVVMDANATVLGAQSTADLEQGRGYSDQAFLAFIEKWE